MICLHKLYEVGTSYRIPPHPKGTMPLILIVTPWDSSRAEALANTANLATIASLLSDALPEA